MASKRKPPKGKPKAKAFTFDDVTVDLNDQQKLFCMEYVRNQFNGYKAAVSAGYSANSARAQASYLLTNPNIQGFIEKLKADLATLLGISAYDIAKEYARIGFSDIRKIFDSNNSLIDIKKIKEDEGRIISSVEVYEEFAGKGEDRTPIGQTKKIRFYDKVKALDQLARMLGVDGIKKVQNVNYNSAPMTKEEVEEISKKLEEDY